MKHLGLPQEPDSVFNTEARVDTRLDDWLKRMFQGHKTPYHHYQVAYPNFNYRLPFEKVVSAAELGFKAHEAMKNLETDSYWCARNTGKSIAMSEHAMRHFDAITHCVFAKKRADIQRKGFNLQLTQADLSNRKLWTH